MICLQRLAAISDESELKALLKSELEQVDGTMLPLQQGLSQSSFTDGKNFSVSVLSASIESNLINAKVGVMYKGIVAGCNCADDPSPVPQVDEYCELALTVDRRTGETKVVLAG